MNKVETAKGGNTGDVNLLDLWRVLVKQKTLIFTIIVVSVMLGLVYILITKPVYKAESHIFPPLSVQVQGLTLPNIPGGYTTDDVYNRFKLNLRSREIRRQVFDTHIASGRKELDQGGLIDLDLAFSGFDKTLRVSRSEKQKPEIVVSFESHNAVLSAKVVNDTIKIAQTKTRDDLFLDLNFKLNRMKRELSEKISLKRSKAAYERLDRIEVLKEGLTVAEKLNRADLVKLNYYEDLDEKSFPIYLFGKEALKAELSVLQARKNNDPFIIGLRELEQTLSMLNSIVLNKSEVFVARVDQVARVPQHSTNAKKELVLLLASFFGLVFGVGIVLVLNAIRQNVER